ncbi:cbb3-type cytochrome c oxidase subunit I [Acidocella sp.]|uniref:cbb3-type cytochrome c oxidase subunit I n=1 Tax=Acidocella sp. TaxID=50710 RepID=UPI0026099676|nr:cbb3-type cytochrome c oxidase subunit I [Acidocella sp.]
MQAQLPGPWSPLLGRLTLDQIPYQVPILQWTFAGVVVIGLAVVFCVLYFRKAGYLWREWLTTVDHKKIGVMYIVVGLVMLFRGFVDGLMMRTQQVLANGPNAPGIMGAQHGFLPPYHFDQVYSAHGTIMILFAATPILTGFQNIVVPLQIGARDMAFPYMNALSLWLTTAGAALVMLSLFVGDFSAAGWVGLIPLTELPFSPGTGVDYWMWAIQISSVGTTLNAINMITTIVEMRAPGMSWFRLPVFSWTTLSSNIIALTAFPVLGVALALLGADRYLGAHFFTAGNGGNLMLYTNLFWIWGHPEVYFLILPVFGILSEVVPTFSEKPLFGYVTMVAATFAIAGISWLVWLHHFFTMGAGPDINGFFSVATMLVGIPTGVKVFNWAFTLYRGRIHFSVPMLWALFGLFLLLAGGLTGMMLALPAINYTVHDSVFLVAHFHCMVLLVVAAAFAGVTYWFPKLFGFKLDEGWGKAFFWVFTLGTVITFAAMFALGFEGETRRLDWTFDPAWKPMLIVEEFGIMLYVVSIVCFVIMLAVSIRDRAKTRLAQPWPTARTLEWLTHTPVPFYNFAVTPQVNMRDELAWRREHGLDQAKPDRYEAIHMPSNSALPVIIGALAGVWGFAMIWRIWWLAGLSLAGIIVCVIIRSFDKNEGYYLQPEEIEAMETNLAIGAIIAEQPDRSHSSIPAEAH